MGALPQLPPPFRGVEAKVARRVGPCGDLGAEAGEVLPTVATGRRSHQPLTRRLTRRFQPKLGKVSGRHRLAHGEVDSTRDDQEERGGHEGEEAGHGGGASRRGEKGGASY